MQLPFNPAGSIQDDLTNTILLKHQLPPSHRGTWSDFRTTKRFHDRLRAAERAAVDVKMNVSHPNVLQRTWVQYEEACQQQVTIYRIGNPLNAVAASAKTDDSSKATGDYCFGCNQEHDPTKCGIVAAIVAAHPQYKRVLRAKRKDPMQIPVDGYTLLVSPGFAPVFNMAPRRTENTTQRPRHDQARGRGRGGRGGRGGRARGRSAVANAVANDAPTDTYVADYDADTVTTMFGF